jgi:serine/threonine protein kinase
MARSYRKDEEPIPGYRLAELLGRGDAGEVWRAVGPGEVECAFRTLSLGQRQEIKAFRSLRLLKRIHHPHLTPILAFWLKDGQGQVYAENVDLLDSGWLREHEMELFVALGLGEKSLAGRLRECRKEGRPGIPLEELLGYMEDTAKAIDFLNQPHHDLGGNAPAAIHHGKIKPTNLLLVGGAVEVCDFGMARQLTDAQQSTLLGRVPVYSAPEALMGRPDRTSDQYSLALTYVELRTGTPPAPASTLAGLAGPTAIDLSALTSAEEALIRRATALELENRFPSALEMVQALRQAVAIGLSAVALPATGQSLFAKLRPGLGLVSGYSLEKLVGSNARGCTQYWHALGPGERRFFLKVMQKQETSRYTFEAPAWELLTRLALPGLRDIHSGWLFDREGRVLPDGTRQSGVAHALVIASPLGKTLLERLRDCQQDNKGGVPRAELLEALRQIASLLDDLHEPRYRLAEQMVSVHHCDIKPEHLLQVGNKVRLIDFSRVQVLDAAAASVRQESPTLTLAYSAPERFANKLTRWSDQYALALTYYHLRTGQLPFRATWPTQIFRVHVEGQLELGGLPDAEQAVLRKATALEPSKRFPSCTGLVDALEQAAGPGRG